MKRVFLIVLASVIVTLLISMPLTNASTGASTYTAFVFSWASGDGNPHSMLNTGSVPQSASIGSSGSGGSASAIAIAGKIGNPGYQYVNGQAKGNAVSGATASCPGGTKSGVWVPLSNGITLIQEGNSNASYEISVIDVNTTTTFLDVKAFLSPQGLHLWAPVGSWDLALWPYSLNGTGWVPNLPANSTGYRNAAMNPGNLTIQGVPTGDIANQTQIAIAAATTGESFAYNFVPSSVTGVGGTVVPANKLALLGLLAASYAPSIGLAVAAIIAVALATSIYVKRVKRRQEKQ